jgi:CBS domain-containing protein
MQKVTSEHYRGTGALLITQKGKLTGIITERDLVRRVISQKRDIKYLTAGQVMTAQPETLTAEDPIAFALNLMHLGHYRHIPLVDEENEPVGIITSKDIIKYISQFIKSI